MNFELLGDNALTITISEDASPESVVRVAALADALRRDSIAGVREVVAVYGALTIYYDAHRHDIDAIIAKVQPALARIGAEALQVGRTKFLEIPVRYGGGFGPDLGEVADRADLSPRDVADLHASVIYTVGAVGFMPGFAYLLGLPAPIHTPRRDSPRTRVPAGSVAIGGAQTGVYPSDSPGGWNLIGQTTMRMFDPAAPQPSRLCVGDRVRFVPVLDPEPARCK